MSEIPDFILKRIEEINKYKNNELPEPNVELTDIWSMDPKRLFPDSTELQRYFIDVREKQKYNF